MNTMRTSEEQPSTPTAQPTRSSSFLSRARALAGAAAIGLMSQACICTDCDVVDNKGKTEGRAGNDGNNGGNAGTSRNNNDISRSTCSLQDTPPQVDSSTVTYLEQDGILTVGFNVPPINNEQCQVPLYPNILADLRVQNADGAVNCLNDVYLDNSAGETIHEAGPAQIQRQLPPNAHTRGFRVMIENAVGNDSFSDHIPTISTLIDDCAVAQN